MTNAALRAFVLGSTPAMRRLAAEAVEWEKAMSELAITFGLPLDVTKERFEQRRLHSVLSWRQLVSWCFGNGEL